MKQMTMALLSVLVMGFTVNALAGSLDSPSAPGATSSYTLEDIYNRLNTGAAATQSTFTEPAAGPGSTGHTLDEVYDLTNERAFVPKTGQTTSYGTGDDGDLEKGVSSPTPRFTANTDNNGDGDCDDPGEICDGTVTDNLTGLIWLQNGNCGDTVGGVTGPTMTWADALTFCDNLADGDCGLSDGSSAGDWWLPNFRELLSLIDYEQYNPAMTAGHPFTVAFNIYWSSTTLASNTGNAWCVYFDYGFDNASYKSYSRYVRAVRAGQ